MSKLIGILEAFNAIDSIKGLIKICDVAIADAERLSKKEINPQNKTN